MLWAGCGVRRGEQGRPLLSEACNYLDLIEMARRTNYPVSRTPSLSNIARPQGSVEALHMSCRAAGEPTLCSVTGIAEYYRLQKN